MKDLSIDIISIHAPAKGATVEDLNRVRLCKYFNPRTREGCDTDYMMVDMKAIKFQSTHPRRVRPFL